MTRKGLALILSLILFGSLIMANGIGLGAPLPLDPVIPLWPEPTFPAPTKDPAATSSTADATVNIPDEKLKAALRAATGVSAQSAIKRSDLAKLSGGLDLTDKGIVRVEGLQYCEHITALKLADNKIADLPSSFSKLTNLQILILDDNKLTKMPDALFSLTQLTTLSIARNLLSKVSDKINLLAQLTSLDLSGNKLTVLPANISKLSKLKYLTLANNEFRDISRDIFQLPVLEYADLSHNWLSDLPNEAAAMPKLITLNLTANILDTLPAGLGNAPSLQKVYASTNRLTTIEPSLLSGKVSTLTLDVNRLTDLPQVLSGKTFETFSIEWNFIDMAEGSETRKIADSVIAPSGKNYLRQLKFLAEPLHRETISTVVLQWSPLEDGQDGDGVWKVNKYQIYQDAGANKPWKLLADVDKLAGTYVVTNLKAETSYKFHIGVEYSLTVDGKKVTPPPRYFTSIEVKTQAASATAEPTVEPTAEPSATELEATLTPAGTAPAGTEAPAPAPKGNSTLLVILIIAGAVVAIALVWVVVMSLSRRNQRPY